MATVSMPAGAAAENAFGNMALQLSPAFRSANQRALRQRQHLTEQQQKLRELARSDEFSDDESDGVDSDDDGDDEDEDAAEVEERADTFEDRKLPHTASFGMMTPRRHSPYHRTQNASANATVADTIDLDDDLVDVKETMYVPYRPPPRADRSPRMDRFTQRRLAHQQRRQQQQQQQLDATPSPKVTSLVQPPEPMTWPSVTSFPFPPLPGVLLAG